MNFQQINNQNNYGKIYLAINNITPYRRIFVTYNNDTIFTYFSLLGNEIQVIYPDDFHGSDDIMFFYELKLPDDVIKKIQSYGTQYNNANV